MVLDAPCKVRFCPSIESRQRLGLPDEIEGTAIAFRDYQHRADVKFIRNGQGYLVKDLPRGSKHRDLYPGEWRPVGE